MAKRRSRISDERRQAALTELCERAEEIRDAVRVHVLSAGGLRQAAKSSNETAEDVAQAVFLKLWSLIREGDPDAIRDLKAYAKRMADNHVASLARRPAANRIDVVDPESIERLAIDAGSSPTPESIVERRLSAAQVESLVARLTPKQALLVKMRAQLGMSVPEIGRVLGETTKSCEKQLDRAIEQIKDRLAELEDLDMADRRRLSRVMAVKCWGTPSLVAGLQRDMRADLRLASLWRQSNGALHDLAGAVAIDESLRHVGTGPRLSDHVVGLFERARDAVATAVSRSGPEHEVAAGAAAGGAGAAKAMVAVCLAGTAAGGACVATGVVDLPHGNGKPVADKPAADKTVGESPTETATTASSEPPAAPPSPEPVVTETTPAAEKTVEPATKEIYGAGSTASSSGSRDFAAPVGGSNTSGGGGGGSSRSRENFGP